MLTDFLYNHLISNTSRPATWALRQLFRLHASNLEDMPAARFSIFTAMNETKEAKRCAEIMRDIGTERLSMLRQWMPLEMPETLNVLSLEKLREQLENIQAWEKGDKPQTPCV